MRVFLGSFAAVALAIAPLEAAVDPGLLSLVMPGATVVAGFQVEQAQSSPFGKYLMEQIRPQLGRNRALESAGFDPFRDLKEVLVATADGSAVGGLVGKDMLVLGRGVFQPGRIAAAAALAGAPGATYRGLQILGAPNQPGIAFLDASTIAIGQPATIRAVIDRGTGASYSGALAGRIREVSSSYAAWFVANTPEVLAQSPLSQGNEMQTRILKIVKQVAGGVRFGGSSVGLTAEAETTSAQDAQALTDVLRFMAGMAQSDPKAAQFLGKAQFSNSGATMRVSLELTEEQAEGLFAPRQRSPRPARAQRN